MSVGSAFKAANLIQLCPYVVSVGDELNPTNTSGRIWFCILMLKILYDGLLSTP
jgi:hypothetical protein